MTTDETPADVIEQAAKVIRPLVDTIYGCAIDGGYQPPKDEASWPFADRLVSRLADAGLLADPADRDEPCLHTRMTLAELDEWYCDACGVKAPTWIKRITDSAEAEVARLKAERDHAQEVAELAEKDLRTYHQDAIRAEAEVAELRATVAAVRSVCQNTDGDWLDGDAEIPVGEVLRMLTLDGTRALDGGGQS